MATLQNRPNAVVAPSTENFVSLVGGDMHQPQWFGGLIRTRPGEAKQFSTLMKFMGRDTAVHEPSYFDFSDRGLTRSVRTTGAVAPGAGNPQTYTVVAGDMFNGISPVRISDQIILYNAATGLQVSTIVSATPAANTFTLEPLNSTDQIPAVAANAVLTLVRGSGAWGDATGQPLAISPIYDRNTHYLSELKDTWEISGWEQSNVTWLSEAGGKWSSQLEYTTLDRINEAYNSAILTSAMPTALNPNIPAAIGTTTQMTGIIPWAQSGGNTQNYIAGNLSLGDFDNLSDVLAGAMVERDYSCLMGTAVGRQFDDICRAAAPNGGIVYGVYAGAKEIALSLQFKQFDRGAFTFTKVPLTAFDNPNGLGATTLNLKNMIVGLPMGMVANVDTGGSAPAFELTHKEGNGINQEWEQWWDGAGAMSTPKIGPTNTTKRYYRRHVGTWPKWAQGYFIMTP